MSSMTTATTEKKNIDYNTICPKVRRLVRVLNEHGFDTFASGDDTEFEGVETTDFAFVVIRVKPDALISESRRLHALLLGYGVKVHAMGLENDADVDSPNIQASYDPVEDLAIVTCIGIEDKMLNEPS